MDSIIATALAFPFAVIGLLFVGSLLLAFYDHLKSASAFSIIFFVVTLLLNKVTIPVAVASAVGYFVFGVLWSRIRWKSHNINSIESLETIKKNFDDGKIDAKEAQSRSDVVRENMLLSENKERVACWILGFIPSFIYHFSNDLITHLKEFIVTHLSGMYAKITRNYSEKAESFQYETKITGKSED
ncbi:hypothetical protein LMH73_023940 [Vibrio splendidus]|nr:hypothetical protein [Vibrio splendidus]MCC4883195.1 hypothetical protein [Vibrio splendidus]